MIQENGREEMAWACWRQATSSRSRQRWLKHHHQL